MKFARLTRISWMSTYADASVWVNFEHVVGMSNAAAASGGGAFIKFLMPDTSTSAAAVPSESIFGEPLALPVIKGAANWVPLTRTVAIPGYSPLVWVNLTQGATAARNATDTETRIRLALVWQTATIAPAADELATTPPGNSMDSMVELFVVETPEQIAALAAAATSSTMKVVTLQVKETVERILELIA